MKKKIRLILKQTITSPFNDVYIPPVTEYKTVLVDVPDDIFGFEIIGYEELKDNSDIKTNN